MELATGRIRALMAVAKHCHMRLAAIVITLALVAMMFACAGPKDLPKAPPDSQDTEHKPFFLVASPDMPDPVFAQTVILMLPPSQEPIVGGIVINKPTPMTLRQLLGPSPAIRDQAQSVYFGGPVDLTTPVVLMRSASAPDATTHLFEDVYMSMDAASIRDFLQRPGAEKDLRFFLGRAQWTPDQLHSEILRGAWVVATASPELVFSPDPGSLWRVLVQRAKLRQVDWKFGVTPAASGFCISDTTRRARQRLAEPRALPAGPPR